MISTWVRQIAATISSYRITETSNRRVTEAGDPRVVE